MYLSEEGQIFPDSKIQTCYNTLAEHCVVPSTYSLAEKGCSSPLTDFTAAGPIIQL